MGAFHLIALALVAIIPVECGDEVNVKLLSAKSSPPRQNYFRAERVLVDGGFFFSMKQQKPWVQVSFIKTKITGVTIVALTKCCGFLLRELQIRAGLRSTALTNRVVSVFKGPGETGKLYVFKFKKPVTARYLTIVKNTMGTLAIKEIRVHTKDYVFPANAILPPTPAPKTTPRPTSSPQTQAEAFPWKDRCVLSTNMYRRKHTNTGPLKWDTYLAQEAQKYADKLLAMSYKNKSPKLVHEHPSRGMGENLFWGDNSKVLSCRQANKAWYDEINNYDYKTAATTNGKAVGHFTALVWKDSTKFGIGIASGKSLFFGRNKQTFIVAKYSPMGNSYYLGKKVEKYTGEVQPLV